MNDLIGSPYKIIQTKEFSYNLDTVLLANFTENKKSYKNILEIGCSHGAILLYLHHKLTFFNCLHGIDINNNAINLCLDNITLNNLENASIKLFTSDVKNFSFKKDYDLIICNPPYFNLNTSNKLNENKQILIKRHEITLTLEEMFFHSARLIKFGGTLNIVFRSSRLSELINIAKKHDFTPKIIRFVHTYLTSSAKTVLISFGYKTNSNTIVLEPLVLYDKKNSISQNLKNIYKEN